MARSTGRGVGQAMEGPKRLDQPLRIEDLANRSANERAHVSEALPERPQG